jgi:putative RNA 2'-phosphotransferase
MDQSRLVRLSKRMSKVLRHDPGRVGLRLDPAGWVPVDEFLAALGIDRSALDEVVAGNDKRRFAVETGPDGVDRVRANQGHSIEIDLGLTPTVPPTLLFHGTGTVAAESIRETGLHRGGRHHVHLAADTATAYRVGSRRGGRVVVFTVLAEAMAADGYDFFRSDNGVWLTDEVPVGYLRE